MKLYHLTGCPYCKMVTDKMATLGIVPEIVEVPRNRGDRHEVFAVSKQWTVPVLVDGDTMLDDEEKILPYLDAKYGQAS